MTAAEPMLASPGRGVRIACRVGYSERWVPPFSLRAKRGAKPSEEQLEAWKGTVAVALMSRGSAKGALEPVRVELSERGSQLVGLRVRFGPGDVDADVAQVQRDAVEDVGDRVRGGGVDRDLGGVGG